MMMIRNTVQSKIAIRFMFYLYRMMMMICNNNAWTEFSTKINWNIYFESFGGWMDGMAVMHLSPSE